jgi:hypothetical protein
MISVQSLRGTWRRSNPPFQSQEVASEEEKIPRSKEGPRAGSRKDDVGRSGSKPAPTITHRRGRRCHQFLSS